MLAACRSSAMLRDVISSAGPGLEPSSRAAADRSGTPKVLSDVLVVGGGPSGTALAAELAARGLRQLTLTELLAGG